MSNYKEQYIEATKALDSAIQARIDATIGILQEFLAQKGLEPEQSCVITYGSGKNEKSVKGVFRIVTSTQSADLKFLPYKKDGTVSKNPLTFCFGKVPNLVWENALNLITSVVTCETPSVTSDGEEE